MNDKKTLLDRLKDLYPESSLQTLKGWIKQKRVLVDQDLALSPSQLVKHDSQITLSPKKKFLKDHIPILYHDKDIAVVDKPAGLLTVATDKEKEQTLHHFLKRYFYKNKVYPVHRLDKETSGLILFALNEKAKNHLKAQFLHRSLSRHYMALVHGIPDPQIGFWESYLYEDDHFKMHQSSDKQGQWAKTYYKTIYSLKKISLLDICLETGRKNQIRVQSAHHHLPILGDKKYSSIEDGLKRLALHAYLLKFNHPKTQKKLCFKSILPQELTRMIQAKVCIDEKTLSLQMG